jgi:hypothetical protein
MRKQKMFSVGMDIVRSVCTQGYSSDLYMDLMQSQIYAKLHSTMHTPATKNRNPHLYLHILKKTLKSPLYTFQQHIAKDSTCISNYFLHKSPNSKVWEKWFFYHYPYSFSLISFLN